MSFQLSARRLALPRLPGLPEPAAAGAAARQPGGGAGGPGLPGGLAPAGARLGALRGGGESLRTSIRPYIRLDSARFG